jgi:hypothetical protein
LILGKSSFVRRKKIKKQKMDLPVGRDAKKEDELEIK